MATKIIVLEDNAERLAAMRDSLNDRLSTFDARFFASAKEIISFLAEHAEDTIAISLDHDLEPILNTELGPIDAGTGRDVADYLAARSPFCPVVIHSSNSGAVLGMQPVLADAGWTTHRVVPGNDMSWVAEWWLPTLEKAIFDYQAATVVAEVQP